MGAVGELPRGKGAEGCQKAGEEPMGHSLTAPCPLTPPFPLLLPGAAPAV